MHIFINSLKENNEENQLDLFYKETIDLYTVKKGFSFLIELFIEIYKKKELCPLLMDKFREINESQKDNEKNMDRKEYLNKHISTFDTIKSEADKLIEEYNYKNIDFYGIILCYLNFYNQKAFSLVINELFNKKPNDLYEILLIYNSHFKNPVHQNFDFFNEFIKYTISEKDFSFFERGLSYIKDIETYMSIFEKNKEQIYNKYIKDNKDRLKHIIKLDKNLKNLKPEYEKENKSIINETSQPEDKNNPSEKMTIKEVENSNNNQNTSNQSVKKIAEDTNKKIERKQANDFIFKIIKSIKLIIEFSCKNKTFLIYFTNNFWKYILNCFNEPNQDNIYICFELRKVFIEYYKLVIEVFKDKEKKFVIKNDAINYFELDEFAFLLDQIIRRYIINNKELENIEKLAFITQYNPYYIDRNVNKIDANIFDSFNLNNIDDNFI